MHRLTRYFAFYRIYVEFRVHISGMVSLVPVEMEVCCAYSSRYLYNQIMGVLNPYIPYLPGMIEFSRFSVDFIANCDYTPPSTHCKSLHEIVRRLIRVMLYHLFISQFINENEEAINKSKSVPVVEPGCR